MGIGGTDGFGIILPFTPPISISLVGGKNGRRYRAVREEEKKKSRAVAAHPG